MKPGAMLTLVFAHTVEEPPLHFGPLPWFRIEGALIKDHEGAPLARHNGDRWVVEGKIFYRMDCEGPVTVQPEGCGAVSPRLGPFFHFSLFNGIAYASRDLFAHYREQDNAWHLHKTEDRCAVLVVSEFSRQQ
jgi:hypothetical protein